MKPGVKIRRFKKSDSEEVAKIIRETFWKFVRKDANKKGAERYFNFYADKEKFLESFLKSPVFFVALEKNKIIGMVRGNKSHLVNFYVKKQSQKKGIGKMLMDKFENECKKQKASFVKVRASLFSTPIYQKLGYKKTTGVRNIKGIKMQPMKKIL